MDPSVSSQQTEAGPAPFARFCEFAVVLLLCAGLLYPVVLEHDGASYVVSIADADRAIVVSLAGFGVTVTVEPNDLPLSTGKDRLAPADEPKPASASAASWPVRLRGMIVERAREAPHALATIIGVASMYNPFLDQKAADIRPTASGEHYDIGAWTAAIQIDLRDQFGGVRYGRLYRPAFALIEHGHRRAIVKINDVGPLRPGRVIDLNERAMRYFDPTMRLGLVHGVKISLLPGNDWTPGPVETSPLLSVASTQ